MTQAHVFVETNFLFGVFRMPSRRHRDALALKAQFGTGDVKLYVPYLCFQEARNLIAKSLPSNRCSDLLEFHRFAADSGTGGIQKSGDQRTIVTCFSNNGLHRLIAVPR